MKLGGLFSGIGGFELAWTQLGHDVAWMCEIDKKARKVLEAQFPGVTIYEDVRDIDPAEVEAVDVLTGGSPCQGFSVAGSRTGLQHGESQLFADYVRIANGLADRGLRYAIWENVPGVLSIKNPNGERTFPHVISGLLGADDPVPLDPKHRWNVGLAVHEEGQSGERAVAWRVLDSQHFGVAQRRRRVFACVAFGNAAADRAGRSLLAVSEGMRGYSSAGEPAEEGAAGSVGQGVEGARGFAVSSFGLYREGVAPLRSTGGDFGSGGSETLAVVPDVAQRLTTGTGQRYDAETETIVPDQPAVLMTMREGKDGGGKGPLLSEEKSLTLATGNGQTLFQPQAFDEINFTTDDDTHHVLRAGTKQSTGAVTEYGVRRLTPTECERLQAFPDGWTEPAGSDTARYKALGNAVTVNTVRWILSRLNNVEGGEHVSHADGR